MIEQYEKLVEAYDFFRVLFTPDELPLVLFTMQRKRGANGYFGPDFFQHTEGKESRHELALNPEALRRPSLEVLGTLVHEMVHVWQEAHGKPGKNGYHNKQWADKMLEVGLTPVSKNGKGTGPKVGTAIPDDGQFRKMADQLIGGGWHLDWASLPRLAAESNTTRKTSYKCGCSTVYGKPGLAIRCNICLENMEEQ